MNCPECQTELPEGAKFCLECGHALGQPKATAIDYRRPHSYTPKHLKEIILSTRSAIEGERKIVTVMFADVAGFTPMSEKLDPEDVHRIMNGCFAILLDEIHKVEGTVNEFRGDGVMALFGAPIAHEDHAHRACYAALAVQNALAAYGETLKNQYGIDFKMRIGLNSGPVVVGVIGDDLRMDYTAQGDTANLAARMETNAEPGTVLVANQTYRLTKDLFEYEPLGKLQVKGKEKPVEAYRLKDTASRLRPRPVREVYSEMIGRDQELSRLELQILKAVNGQGSAVNVIGEAGIGKSRLTAELKKCPVMKKVTFLEGRAISTGKNLNFHPIIDLLKNWALIRENDTEPAALTKLETAIRRVSVEDADEIFPFVATLMGMKLSGKHADRMSNVQAESLEKLIFKNVRDLVIRSTETTPLVILIEDLHWADTSSRLLLDSLYRLAMTQKVVFINVFRPGYWDGDELTVDTLAARLPELSVVDIALRPLDLENSQALINSMLNVTGFHHDVKQQIVERAGGNPFFIEEVVRTLIDEGALVVTDSGFEVTDKIHSVVIPPTIQDVLMARIDRLDEESRSLVKVASVIGRSFFHRVLAEVVSRADHLGDRLAYLKEIQLIRERIRMEELEYLFKHALAQEAAYESTLLQQRKELHQKVAESIERLFHDRLHEFYGILALHYGNADNLEKAEEYMVKAGEEALRSSASSEAINYFQQALRSYVQKHGKSADPEKVAQFERNIALAYFNKANHKKALPYFDRVLSAWGRKPMTSNRGMRFQIARDLLIITLRLYLPWTTRRRIPDQRASEALDIACKRNTGLIFMNPTRAFAEFMGELRKSFRYDLSSTTPAGPFYSRAAAFLAVAGLFRISRMLLNTVAQHVHTSRTQDIVIFQISAAANHYLAGSWDEIPEYSESLFDSCEKNGLFDSAAYLTWHEMVRTDRGEFRESSHIEDKLALLEERYQYVTVIGHLLPARLLVTRRSSLAKALGKARSAASLSIEYGVEPYGLLAVGWGAVAQVLMGDLIGARESLAYTDEVRSRRSFWPPFYLGSSLLAQFLLDLQNLEGVIGGDSRSLVSDYSKAALKSGKKSVKNSAKSAAQRTWNYRLMGEYYWLVGRQRKALKWFDKSIKEGERLGARPDLSRSYMEVGKRLLEPRSTYRELNGIRATEYLAKAEAMFRDMDLEWDLEQLERIRQ